MRIGVKAEAQVAKSDDNKEIQEYLVALEKKLTDEGTRNKVKESKYVNDLDKKLRLLVTLKPYSARNRVISQIIGHLHDYISSSSYFDPNGGDQSLYSNYLDENSLAYPTIHSKLGFLAVPAAAIVMTLNIPSLAKATVKTLVTKMSKRDATSFQNLKNFISERFDYLEMPNMTTEGNIEGGRRTKHRRTKKMDTKKVNKKSSHKRYTRKH